MSKYLDITDYDRIVNNELWAYDTSELEEMPSVLKVLISMTTVM